MRSGERAGSADWDWMALREWEKGLYRRAEAQGRRVSVADCEKLQVAPVSRLVLKEGVLLRGVSRRPAARSGLMHRLSRYGRSVPRCRCCSQSVQSSAPPLGRPYVRPASPTAVRS